MRETGAAAMIKHEISACIMTFNEEHNIRRCLESVTWCDEIIVVDSFSDDKTVEIARAFTDQIYSQQWTGYIEQRNFLKSKATREWVLFLDADEAISPPLKDEIIRELSQKTIDYAGFMSPRLVFYLDAWIRHGEWYPDLKLRIFKKNRGVAVGIEPHDQVLVDGPVKVLKNPIHHYTYTDIADHIEKMNRYSSITAREKALRHARFRWIDFVFRPLWRFIRGYFIQGGFLCGRRGFLVAIISSFGVSMKYAKLWEIEIYKKRKLKE